MDSWTLNLTSADPVTITVTRTSGTLSPTITLLGANQQQMTGTRADETWATATVENWTPPGPGQYTVVVSRYSNADGGTSGGYQLTVTQSPKQ